MTLRSIAGRRLRSVFVAVAVVATALVWAPPGRGAEPAPSARPFPEVGRLPLFVPPGTGSVSNIGWLILNPVTRRGYQVFEGSGSGAVRTYLQSFDLDTLRPLRRVELAGIPVTAGPSDAAVMGNTSYAGEVVHAVDEAAGRIYLALAQQELDTQPQALLNAGAPADGQRPHARFVAIDEAALDRGDPAFAASFREPPGQERLHPYWVVGMKVSRHRTTGGCGRLLVLYAQPRAATVPADHTLAQWEPPCARSEFSAAAAMETERDRAVGNLTLHRRTLVKQATAAGLPRRLDGCSSGLASTGGHGNGGYQWGMLVAGGAVWTACQAAEGAGAAVRIPLAEDGTLAQPPPPTLELYRMSKSISDVLADDGGGRLLIKSYGNGHTWWAFDTRLRRFTGASTAKASDVYSYGAGLDPATGRLYQLIEDYAAIQGGRQIPVRGGFSYSDTRLDPPPPMTNARPELAYPAAFAIRVDPATRRVFLRRGHPGYHNAPTYPGTVSTTPAPPEDFYRVLLDNVPVSQAPPPPDDSAFTTDVAESALTRASFLGSGSGYGSRVLLVGGLNAAADRKATVGACGPDDRELLAGSVRRAEVSDITAAADAASLDGDALTREQLGRPLQRCATRQSHPDVDEAAFDQAGREGENLYRATCTGDDEGSAGAPAGSLPGGRKALPRDRYRAAAACAHAQGRATARSEGAISAPPVDGAQDEARRHSAQVPAQRVEVGYASTTVSAVRRAGGGMVVTVDAVAREVTVPGVGTIGAVRATATAAADGRRAGAGATYSRTVCNVEFATLSIPGCVDDGDRGRLEARMNEALGARGKVRFRHPDPALLAGSASGYASGVERPTADAFEDATIARDVSRALPAMELVLYNGDSDAGAGRQFVHLAGVQAAASYGLACLHGTRPDGRCAADGDEPEAPDGDGDDGGDFGFDGDGSSGGLAFDAPTGDGGPSGLVLSGGSRTRLLTRVLQAPFRAAAGALRLLANNPREFALMGAVWLLLYGPFHTGERRRRLKELRSRRAALGGAA